MSDYDLNIDSENVQEFEEEVEEEEDCKHDIFGLLMYCYLQLTISEKYILKLLKKIAQQTNEKVCIGIARMNS